MAEDMELYAWLWPSGFPLALTMPFLRWRAQSPGHECNKEGYIQSQMWGKIQVIGRVMSRVQQQRQIYNQRNLVQSCSISSPPSKPHPPVTRASGAVPKGFKLPKKSLQWGRGCCQATSPVQSSPTLVTLKMVGAWPLIVERNTLDSFSINFLLLLSFSLSSPCSPLSGLPARLSLWSDLHKPEGYGPAWLVITQSGGGSQTVPAGRLQAAGLSGVIRSGHVASKLSFPILSWPHGQKNS